jgi:hypothetical protein
MKNMSDYMGQELEIINTSFFKSAYELRAPGKTIVTLRSTDFWGNKHEIAGIDKTWEVVKPNIWTANLNIQEKNTGTIIADIKGSVFKNSGVINLPRGEKLSIVMSVWKSTFEIQNELGTPLVSFKNKKWYSSDVIVTILKKSETLDRYPFLIMLAFLMVMQKRHSSGTTVM